MAYILYLLWIEDQLVVWEIVQSTAHSYFDDNFTTS